MNSSPTLSIITINLNNSAGLGKTIGSVLSQTFSAYEYLVIDGASTDGSVGVILKYVDKITYWISEPDNGIYHAMNKATRAAKGEYCLFLNSGDWLVDNKVLEKVFSIKVDADILTGNVYFYDTMLDKIHSLEHSPNEITAKTIFYGYIPHQASFIRRDLFAKVGMYNENYEIASDWLFCLEAFLKHGATYKHIDEVIAYFNLDGISCQPKTSQLPRQEQMAILKEKYPLFIDDYQQLIKLEKHFYEYYTSREYKVINFLNRIGFISICVFFLRAINFLKRKFG